MLARKTQPSDPTPSQNVAPSLEGMMSKPAQPEPPLPVRLYRAEAMARTPIPP